MKTKITLGLVVLALVALVPRSSISSSKPTQSNVTLSNDNLVVFRGEVDGETVGPAIAKAKELCNASKQSIKSRVGLKSDFRLKLFLYTPGGSIQSGLELIEAMNGLDCPVDTVTLFAASMGWQIAQNLGERLILKNGVMMSHHATGEATGEFGGYGPTQMENRQQLWLDRVRELDEKTVERTGGKQTYESYTKAYDNELWLTGTKSVDQGYSDRIVAVSCDSSLNGVTTNNLNFMGMQVQYDLDKCPINTSPMNIRVGGGGGDKNAIVTPEMQNMIKEKFFVEYMRKAKQVIPMYW